jgi:hypothetical protein
VIRDVMTFASGGDHAAGPEWSLPVADVVASVAVMTRSTRTLLGVVAVAASATAYLRVYRPWQLRWGATDAEVERPLSGDDLVDAPTFNATRAITIAAAPEQVWPWLVQVGVNRAGWYSYDLLDNLGRPSARQVIPELQHLQPGDVLPMSPDGKHGIRVHSLDEPQCMIWGTAGDTTWVWVLDPLPDGTTRLITRVRSDPRWRPSSLLFAPVLEIADFWMMRRMLLNLRSRIEAIPEPSAGETARSVEPDLARPG